MDTKIIEPSRFNQNFKNSNICTGISIIFQPMIYRSGFMTIKRRNQSWLGHTLGKGQDDITNQSLKWNPQANRKVFNLEERTQK